MTAPPETAPGDPGPRPIAPPERARELAAEASRWPSWTLTPRQLCDLELLLNGGFAPLDGFLCRDDYTSVCREMRLADGALWPIPVVLDVSAGFARGLREGASLALRDTEGFVLAALRVREIWRPDLAEEARSVYGSEDESHPGVAYLLRDREVVYVGGEVEGIRLPRHHDAADLRLGPLELRREFARRGWKRVIAFQTRNPLHRAHFEMTRWAMARERAGLLLHPAVGATRPGDVDHYTRVRCYRAVLPRYPEGEVALALLPLAMRMAGPREALWHALIRRNHGCTHLVVGRDHAGPGLDRGGRPFYGPFEAQELLRRYEGEVGVTTVPFGNVVYVEEQGRFLPEEEVPEGARPLCLSGTELRRRLADGDDIPEWFTFPEVAAELRRRHPPRERQGFTVFFTGLSGAGKSSLARALQARLLETGDRQVTLLDGDVVRTLLSSGLGFSREDRDTNIRRIGFVAAEVVKHGGIAVCAPIAPYDGVRREVRAMVESAGGFVLVHVATPLAVCEARDGKGLYARARAGRVTSFTGISDPYEPPEDAELVLDTTALSAEDAAERILTHLRREGYLR